MRVLDGSHNEWPVGPPSSVTVGVLDGVHTGHRKLVSRLRVGPLVPTVATFEPHPVEVLGHDSRPRLITSLDERIELLEALDVQQVAVLDLREIRDLSPQQFVEEILVGKLAAKKIVAGIDFQFGKDRAGSVALLNSVGPALGFHVDVMELVVDEGVVSSSRIRGLIEAGDVSGAADLLGSRFRLSNVVVPGDERGREIGYPTANLAPPPRKVIPADGVYAAYAELEGSRYPAAVNVGVRPTFDDGGSRLIEAYLLDFSGDLYGKSLTLEFVSRIRDELKFDSVDELVTAIAGDVEDVRARLSVD